MEKFNEELTTAISDFAKESTKEGRLFFLLPAFRKKYVNAQ